MSCRWDGRDMFSRGRRTLLSFRLLESLQGRKRLGWALAPAGTDSCLRPVPKLPESPGSPRPHAASPFGPSTQPQGELPRDQGWAPGGA